MRGKYSGRQDRMRREGATQYLYSAPHHPLHQHARTVLLDSDNNGLETYHLCENGSLSLDVWVFFDTAQCIKNSILAAHGLPQHRMLICFTPQCLGYCFYINILVSPSLHFGLPTLLVVTYLRR